MNFKLFNQILINSGIESFDDKFEFEIIFEKINDNYFVAKYYDKFFNETRVFHIENNFVDECKIEFIK